MHKTTAVMLIKSKPVPANSLSTGHLELVYILKELIQVKET